MCEWGTHEEMTLTIPAHLSHSGKAYEKLVAVDACIAPIVRALNAGGVPTVASCCGHGRGPGNITLDDGRELVVMPKETGVTGVANFVTGMAVTVGLVWLGWLLNFWLY